jgi:hypothetical protein
MRNHWLIPLGLVAAVVARLALASDPPHDSSNTLDPGGTQCASCHTLHDAVAGGLSSKANNFDVCDSCHSSKTGLGFPWARSEQAVPGAGGSHHGWEGDAVNSKYGAEAPLNAEMSVRLKSGKIQCSTCHDQHGSKDTAGNSLGPTYSPRSAHFGPGTLGVAARLPSGTGTPPAGTGQLSITALVAAPLPKGYRVRVSAAGQFQVSHDAGLTTPSYTSSYAYTAGTAVTLSNAADDANLQVTITAGAKVGDYWDFYVTYPFVRVSIANGELCEDCHRSRVMSDTVTGANGTKVFSHPAGMGVQLARTYDRTQGTNGGILDANGGVQGVDGDTITSNDLRLYGSAANANSVTCLSCHSPHNADSNSLTEDP